MALKTKLVLELGFLFLIIFGLVGVCSYYVGSIGQESQNILKDNYYSLVYSKNMLAGVDDMKTSIMSTAYDVRRERTISDYYARLFDSGRKLFETNLTAENNNITEVHEKEYVEKLNQDYDSYLKLCLQTKNGPGGNAVYVDSFLSATERLKQSINAIYDIIDPAIKYLNLLIGHKPPLDV